MPVKLQPEAKNRPWLRSSVTAPTELELELSDVQIAMLLRYVLLEIAPSAYNAGLAAAEVYLRDQVADLEGACAEVEFAYWPQGSVRRK